MKTLLRVLVVLVVLLVAGVFVAVTYAGSLVRAGVERGGTHVLGVETKLDDASLGILSGELGLQGLSVANPPGFEREHFLEMRRAQVAVSLRSLASERIEAPLLLLEGLVLDLERKGDASNYGVILDHVGGPGGEEPAGEEAPGASKKLVIREVVLRDITAHVAFEALGQKVAKSVTLGELRLQNVGNDEQSLRSLLSQIVTAILEEAMSSLEGVVPAELLGDLKGRLAQVQEAGAALQAEAQEKVDEAVQQAQGELEKAKQEAASEAQKALEKGKQELQKGLGDVLGGKKKDGG